MTLTEAFPVMQTDGVLYQKIRTAVVVSCEVVRAENPVTVTNHAARVAWAKRCLADSDGMAALMLKAVIAQNMAASVAVVEAASDAVIQAACNAAIDLLV